MYTQLNIRLSFQIPVTHLYRWVGKEVLKVKCSDEKIMIRSSVMHKLALSVTTVEAHLTYRLTHMYTLYTNVKPK